MEEGNENRNNGSWLRSTSELVNGLMSATSSRQVTASELTTPLPLEPYHPDPFENALNRGHAEGVMREDSEACTEHDCDPDIQGWVLAVCGVVIITGTLNNIIGQIRSIELGAFNSSVALLLNSCAYPIVYWSILYVLYRQKSVTRYELHYIWKASGAWRVLLFCGILDSSSQVLGYIAQPHIPIIIYSLANQTNLFWIAVWSFIIFNRQYVAVECAGITIAVTGAIIAVVSLETSGGNGGTDGGLHWVLILFSSSILTALSIVLKERVFKQFLDHREQQRVEREIIDHSDELAPQLVRQISDLHSIHHIPYRINVFSVASCTSTFSLIFAMPVLCFSAWMNGRDMWGDLSGGFGKVFGDPFIFGITFSYVGINVIFNVSVYLVLSWASALLGFLSMKAITPLTAILAASFVWPVIGRADFPPAQVAALIFILTGIFVYRQGQKWHDADVSRNHCCFPYNFFGLRTVVDRNAALTAEIRRTISLPGASPNQSPSGTPRRV